MYVIFDKDTKKQVGEPKKSNVKLLEWIRKANNWCNRERYELMEIVDVQV